MPSFYISPTGSGLKDGSSIENAGVLDDLPAFIAAAGADGEVLLIADQGAYDITGKVYSIYSGGADGQPVTIRGIDSSGQTMRAEIVGSRDEPFNPKDDAKDEPFRLLEGADNVTIKDLSFKNIGYAAIRVGSDISNLTVENVDFTNVQRAFENYKSGSEPTATISGLTLRNLDVDGFSRGAIRLNDDTHDVLIEDVRADSQFNDDSGDSFPIGVHIEGTAHDIVIRRVTMKNAEDRTSGSYWNGDGFATEGGVYNVLFEDTVASGNTDGGYDLKSSSTVLERTVAEGNGRNYRLWAKDMVLNDIVSLDPHLDGGNSTQNHVFFSRGAQATITDAVFADRVGTTAIQLTEGSAVATVNNLVAMIGVPSALSKRLSGSVITVSGVNYGMSVVSGVSFADSTESLAISAEGSEAHWLTGGQADDVIRGGSGVDRLEGGSGDDVLIGGAGDDVLVGGSGRDVLLGQGGFDIADYSDAAGGIAVDLHSGAPGGAAEGDMLVDIEGVIGSAFDDALYGDAGANLLSGGNGNDVVVGRSGDDMLSGGAGDDLIDGGSGDDYLIGGSGADTIIGGAGVDTVDYSDSEAGVLVDLVSGTGQFGDAQGDRLSGIEVLIGSRHDDVLIAGDGAVRLIGGAGADTLVGSGGDDTVDYSGSNAGIMLDLTSGKGSGGDAEGDLVSAVGAVIGSAFDDTIVGDATANRFDGGAGADALSGGLGNDRLVGGDGNDTLDGGDDDDLLLGGAGADRLIGGAGFDTADYSASAAGVIVDLSSGAGAGGDAEGDTLAGVEAVIGTGLADVLRGDDAVNQLFGGAGDDRLSGGGGADLLSGGAGRDTADYSASATGIFLDLVTGAGEGDTLDSIEVIVGSGNADTIVAGEWTGTIDGGAGDDVITGGSGDDVITGGAGADVIDGGAGIDIADYSASGAGVVVDLGLGQGSGGDAAGDRLTNIEILIGSVHDDVLVGDGGDNILVGSAGADLMVGGGGIDFVDYRASAAGVALSLAAGGTAGDAAGDSFGGITGVYGSAFADSITGDAGDNILVGGSGSDVLRGGDGSDTADYSASSLAVTVSLLTGVGSGGDAAGDTLAEIENLVGSSFADTLTGDAGANLISGGAGADTISGGSGTDTLYGGDGNDTLDGGSEADTMVGGAGDDIYVVDSVDDVVIEAAGEGTDRVRTTLATYTLGADVEALTYLGTGYFTGYGNDLANSFSGSAGVETLYGYGGDDKFFGSAGADTIYGGLGRNSMDYSAAKTAITLNLTTNVNLGGDAEGDLLYDIFQISATNYGDSITGDDLGNTIYGRGGVDTLYGMGGDDRLDGGAGADILYGGDGNDVYVVENVGDQTIEDAAGGIDTVATSLGSWTLAANIENLRTTANGAFAGTGNTLANTITGGDASDLLDGRAGDDTLLGMLGDDDLIGGAGNDTIDGGVGYDTASYSGVLTDYILTRAGSSLILTDRRGGSPDGSDTISNVEAFRFGGTTVSLAALLSDALQAPTSVAFTGAITEGAVAGTLVGTASGSDANAGDVLAYGLVDDAGGRFVIDTATGDVRIANNAVFDFETEGTIGLVVSVTDPAGLIYTQNVSVAISDINEAPSLLTLDGHTIGQDGVADTLVGTLAGWDPDLADTLTYELTDDAGGLFSVDTATGELRLAQGGVIDPAVTSYAITARVSDASGLSKTASFTIDVTSAAMVPYEGDRPDAQANTFLIDTTPGGATGAQSITNFGSRDVLVTTRKIADGNNDGIIQLSTPGVLTIGTARLTMATLDGSLIAKLEYDGKVTQGGVDYHVYSLLGSTQATATTAQLPLSGSAGMTLSGQMIVENAAAGTLVGTAQGIDPDAGTTFGYKLIDDAGGRFTVDSRTGDLRVAAGATLDFEANRSFVVQLAAESSHGTSFQRSYTISIADVNEAPTGLTATGGRVAQGATAGTIVASFRAQDFDAADTLSYSLLDDAGGRFEIDAATGVLKVASGASLTDLDGYTVVAQVADAAGAVSSQSLVITVGVANRAPTGAILTGSVAENAKVGTVVGTVTGIDPDAGEAFTYTLLDTAGGRFALDAGSGLLRVAGAMLDYEKQQSFAVTVRVSDLAGLSHDAVLTVDLTNVVEAQSYAGTSSADLFMAVSDDDWTVVGGSGADSLTTLGGVDIVIGGAGDDVIATGGGDDTIRFSGTGEGYDRIDGGAGTDTIVAMAKNTIIGLQSIAGIEQISAGRFAGVSIAGSNNADTLDFSGVTLTGITRIVGNEGDDTITGSSGDDVLSGGAGNDTLNGGAGDDIFQIYSSSGRDTIDGGAGSDTIQILSNNATMLVGALTSVETISAAGVSGAVLSGTSDDDLLDFSAITLVNIGKIAGGAGNDQILGSNTADLIAGGAGQDGLSGNGGADIFDFDAAADSAVGLADTILDFESGVDRIDLATIDASTRASGNQAFAFIGDSAFSKVAGQLRFEQVGGDVAIYGDVNGDGQADFEIHLLGYRTMTAGDFFL